MSDAAPYELYYWPTIPGRGELVRLVLEDAGAAYVDVCRMSPAQGGGVAALMSFRAGERDGVVPFAPPFLRVGDAVLAHAMHICAVVADREGLQPADPDAGLVAIQHALTWADLISEVHDTHHPIAVGRTYETQKAEARASAGFFVTERLPRFLRYFEAAAARAGGPHLVRGGHCWVDLVAFQVLEGLAHAFPNAYAELEPSLPQLTALRERVRARPRIAAYLASSRRLPFSDGIFRRYPELDKG